MAIPTRASVAPDMPEREFDSTHVFDPPRDLVTRWAALAPQLRSTLRVAAAFMFLQFGTMKLFAFPIGVPPDGGAVPLMSQMGLGALLEVIGGSLLLVGLFTRPVAFLLAGEMAVAYFQFHFPQSFWPVVNQGTPAALYCFVWLYFAAAGAGPWSLDAVRVHRSHRGDRHDSQAQNW